MMDVDITSNMYSRKQLTLLGMSAMTMGPCNDDTETSMSQCPPVCRGSKSTLQQLNDAYISEYL